LNICRPRLDLAFAALSDPTRREIVGRLAKGAARVTDLAGPFDVSLNAVSKHVKVLERAGLVRRTRVGREHRIALNPEPNPADRTLDLPLRALLEQSSRQPRSLLPREQKERVTGIRGIITPNGGVTSGILPVRRVRDAVCRYEHAAGD
jgi:DNA-binding transcriptional ArsR family regulator